MDNDPENGTGSTYSLSFDSWVDATNLGTFTLTVNTLTYDHHADPSYLQSVDIRAWGGQPDGFSLVSAPTGTWTTTEGSTNANGCSGGGGGVCSTTTSLLNVDNGPYVFQYEVTSDNFFFTRAGSHVGASYWGGPGAQGGGYGNTSVQAPPIPEPETYAMMLAGLGLLGFVARRRRQQGLGNLVPA